MLRERMTIIYTFAMFQEVGKAPEPGALSRTSSFPEGSRTKGFRGERCRETGERSFAAKASFQKCFCSPCLPRHIQLSILKFRVWVPVPLGEAVERQELPTGWRTWSLERAGRRTPPPGRRSTTPTSGRRWAARRRGPIGHILGTPPSQRNLEAPRKGKVASLILHLKHMNGLYMTYILLAELI